MVAGLSVRSMLEYINTGDTAGLAGFIQNKNVREKVAGWLDG